MFRTSNGVALAAVIVANLLGGALVAQAQTTTVDNRAAADQSVAAFVAQAQALIAPIAGKTPAQFAVNPSGAATYRIPIEVPPGVAGVQPQLALSYNNQTGNGLLGVGWSIEGLSAITRCPRTMAEDGVRGMVNFDANDRYCLDGQRLILVNGTYGAAGSEYRTEVEGFSKITAVGTAGNGPASFVVQTKAGLTLEYGNTTDSRIEAVKSGINAPWPVGTVRVWAQNKTTDVMGNYMTTSYVEDSVNGEYYPSRMDYTGNATTSPTLSPTASVQFIPANTTRPDVLTAYRAGAIIRTSALLWNIRAYIGTKLVKDYRIGYEQSSASKKMRLLSVTECGSGNECRVPIVASYTNLNIAAGSLTWNGQGVGASSWRMANLFGNGRMVYYTRSGSTHFATQLNEDGTAQSWTWSGHGSGDAGGDMVDLFGDGRQVYYTHNSNGQHFATRLNPDGTSQSWTWNGHAVGGNGWRMANLFGDGRMVYYTRSGSTHFATQLNEDGTAQSWTWSGHGSGNAGGDMVDLFGDGRQVYYTHNSNGQHFATRLNPDGTSQSWTWNGHTVGSNGWRMANLFGDGRMVYYTRSGSTHFATQLNEDGTAQSWTWSGHGSGNAGGDMVDLFGDGRQVYYTHNKLVQHFATRFNPDGTSQSWTWNGHDIGRDGWRMANLFGDGRMVYYTRSDSTHFATQLNDDGTTQSWTWSGHGLGDAGSDMVDLFGDGRQVYYTHNGNGLHFATWFSKGSADLMESVGLPSSKQASLTFKLVTDNSVYTKDTTPNKAEYPRMDVQSPLYVVSRVEKPNGMGGNNATEYSYGGMKAEVATGRRELGFRWIKAKQIETGLETYTEYRQDWPYVGLPKVVETRLSGQGNAGLIKRVTTDYACKTGAGTDCAVVPANCNASDKAASCKDIAQARVFPYLSRSIEQSWDLNGVSYPAITNEVNYILNPDGKFYGEVGKVTVSTSDGASRTTDNVYYPADVSRWILGRVKTATTTLVKP